MVTPKLEELILCGRAFFKTFVAGGTKHTLTFGNDRFIIITDITYFPMNVLGNNDEKNFNTQVAIYGERGYNHFIFRNYLAEFAMTPVTINTFLLHEQQVGFSFVNAPALNNTFIGVADTENPSYSPPLEYGKDGNIGPVPVVLTADANGTITIQNNFTTRPAPGNNESQQLFFPFDAINSFNNNLGGSFAYPILHVNYVEVLGSANNIQI